MISELKEYYTTKHALITACKDTMIGMSSAMTAFYPELHAKVETLYTTIQQYVATTTDTDSNYMSDTAEHMKRVTRKTSTHLTEISTLLNLARQQQDNQLSIENLKQPPNLSKVTTYTYT